ncbi:hypothetical protein AJ79_03986 [Helicocarpus griseus UAMH5409]|uniref:SRR1-like domain-containing protein n=1 Tax=Helicocarpus griseus UAMH5409 TaxID=1447875 RepID=A0A2B7XUJ8_9EURO|nr:hypothetical protein AJ79_03986 [Helicocarpus griseus UAMH5409]
MEVKSYVEALREHLVPFPPTESPGEVKEELQKMRADPTQKFFTKYDLKMASQQVAEAKDGDELLLKEWESMPTDASWIDQGNLASRYSCSDPSITLWSWQHTRTCFSHIPKEPMLTSKLEDPDAVKKSLQTTVAKWEASPAWMELKSTLESANIPSTIDELTAIGCGPMSADTETSTMLRSLHQHALMLTLRKFLEERQGNGSKIICYSQDPAFLSNDLEVMKDAEINMKVLNSPDGFIMADASTVFMAFDPDVLTRELMADFERPAVFIWNRVHTASDQSTTPEERLGDPPSERVKSMINEEYNTVDYEFDCDNIGDIAVYVKNN